jgi:hypothetical protein
MWLSLVEHNMARAGICLLARACAHEIFVVEKYNAAFRADGQAQTNKSEG